MKTIDGIVARCADLEEMLDELGKDLDKSALPNSCARPAEETNLGITARVWVPRLLARQRIPCL